MSRSWALFLEDMRRAVERVERYTKGRDRDAFFADDMAFDATLRNLEILGEAAKGAPQAIRVRHPEIDWRAIAGLRDVLAHAYFGLDDETLWDVVNVKVPLLREQLKVIATD